MFDVGVAVQKLARGRMRKWRGWMGCLRVNGVRWRSRVAQGRPVCGGSHGQVTLGADNKTRQSPTPPAERLPMLDSESSSPTLYLPQNTPPQTSDSSPSIHLLPSIPSRRPTPPVSSHVSSCGLRRAANTDLIQLAAGFQVHNLRHPLGLESGYTPNRSP